MLNPRGFSFLAHILNNSQVTQRVDITGNRERDAAGLINTRLFSRVYVYLHHRPLRQVRPLRVEKDPSVEGMVLDSALPGTPGSPTIASEYPLPRSGTPEEGVED